MRINNYLSVLMCQLNMTLDCNSRDEYLIQTDSIDKQILMAFKIMQEKNPDITLFPEMAYLPKWDQNYKKLSEYGKIVVAGSYYNNGINKTVIFQDGRKYEITKGYASGAEPMTRRITYIQPNDFIMNELKDHEFWIKGKKIYILNCMEYYHAAYYIARNPEYKENLFAIMAICSNSNTSVFEEETIAIHNHNEKLYSFVLNCVSTYKGEEYGDGQSYIYGPISMHEKEWLRKDGFTTNERPTHILSLSKAHTQYLYGEFIDPDELSRFGRSDNYINNPRKITLTTIENGGKQ